MLFKETRRSRPAWRKASFCASGECVEIATQSNMIILRNSSQPRRVVRYTPAEWQSFAQGIRAGEFSDLG